ncbi:MAG: Crp/Fnr family transcriptional regulator [Bacteroidetes bacterium]|nr:Crp/Fnr family transcriptional regulator [Bacteroidota bacterium]
MENSQEIIADSCVCCQKGWKNFRNLTPDELKLVNDNRYEATFKAGEIILKQGSPASNAVFIHHGLAKMYMEGVSGRNLVLGIAQPGRLIAGPGSYVNSRNSYSVSSINMVKACFISFDIIRDLVRRNSDFAEGMIEDISIKSYKSHQRMLSFAHKKMHGRIAETILMFADEIFGSDEFEMLLSRQDLGDMTNMAKESVVRVLKELEQEGIIEVACPKMKITDRARLQIISDRG